jgi:hypothetical protein
MVVSVGFGWLRNSSDYFNCFDIGSKHRNKPKFFYLGFTKQTETDLVSVCFGSNLIFFCLFRGHPIPEDGACGSAPLSVHVHGTSGSRSGQNNAGAARTYCACAMLPTLFKIFSAGLRPKLSAVVHRVPTPYSPFLYAREGR